MVTCAHCGREADGSFAFCPHCGAALAAPEPTREQRKTVTVLFCDLTGSTALGESVDPEALRALLARYFERMKVILESHGGTVEKFIGDAVMAIFGVPQIHEDDALRAVRAAVEMRDAIPELGLSARIGVNTGEVVTGTEERLATGDAVNVAARLEQAASPGEILVGGETLRLVREAVEVEPVEPLDLKGKSQPVPAFRLISAAGEPERRHEAPMVGRETELERLRAAYQQSVRDRSCQLFTVLGAAGVGKSRLAAEALAGIDAIVVGGRCLPYGEGITYWPVVEVIKQLSRQELDQAARQALASVLGEAAPASADEIAWAFRKLLEHAAAERPLVAVFDDIHWGEETFLDLVEHVADLSREAPILLLCMARPELLDRRAAWAGGKLNATSVLLEPLSPDETGELIEGLAGELAEGTRRRVVEAAEGNPLFVEEMVEFARESGDEDVAVPPTIQALLAARLDQLDSSERVVLERGAVEGKVFHRGTVEALAPDEEQVPLRLMNLVRKELVRPDKPMFAGDDAFRFRHLLIRDAAYDALPKATRADLHERFAVWLEQHGRELVELDEILGYHLEAAGRYRRELGSADSELEIRAAERLSAAGRRAAERGDMPAASDLLRRASVLVAGDLERAKLLLELGIVLAQRGDLGDSEAVLGEAAGSARRGGSKALEDQATIELLARRMWREDARELIEEQRRTIERAIPLFEAEGDELGLARAHKWMAEIHNGEWNVDGRAQSLEAALVHARAAGDTVELNEIVNYLAGVLTISLAPADATIARLEELLEEAQLGPVARLSIRVNLGLLYARRGDFERAKAGIGTAQESAREFGLTWSEARMAEPGGWTYLLAGDPATAEREFQRGIELFEAMGDRARRATVMLWLAEAVYRQERFDEAFEIASAAEGLGQEEFPAVRAKVLARRGELDEAVRLARVAAAFPGRDALTTAWLLDAAEVFGRAGLRDEARELIDEVHARAEQSGNVVMAADAARALDALHEDAPASS